MNYCYFCFSIFVTFALLGCKSTVPEPVEMEMIPSLPTQMESDKRSGYRVKIGDQLDVFVLEDKSFNGSFGVRETGEIILPQLGRVLVQGLTLAEVELAVKRQLEKTQLKLATVIVDPSSRIASADQPIMGTVVRVSGRVVVPGRITVPQLGGNVVTAFQAVNEAGGTLPFADKKRSYILRPSGVSVRKIPLNLQLIEDGSAIDIPIYDGDTIVVPPKVVGF